MILDIDGNEVRQTPVHHYPLPPELPGRVAPTFSNNRYRLPDPVTGEIRSWTRATTVAKALDDTYMLNQWRIRKVLSGLARRTHLQADLDQIVHEIDYGDVDDKWERSKLNELADDCAKAADVEQANEFGTSVHDWSAWVDMGLLSIHQVPEIVRDHVRVNLELQAAHQLLPIPHYTERIVASSRWRLAGTLDRIYIDPRRGHLADGKVLGDVKTSKNMDFSGLAFCIQLAFYQSCDLMLSEDGKRWEPMPELWADTAYIMHLPSDDVARSSVQPINLELGREALETAMAVRDIRRRADKHAMLPPDGIAPVPDFERWFAARLAIQTSLTAADVASVWESNQDIWTDALTEIGHATMSALNGNGNEK